MKESNSSSISRRGFIKAGAALASSAVISRASISRAAEKPDSKFNGVQIGAITYSYRGMPGSAEDLLQYLIRCGLSSVELMGGPAEQYAGIPSGGGRGRGQAGRQILDWRLSASMDKFKELRKLYNDAGVNIHIVKFGNIGDGNMPDEEIDYYFHVAKALGARGITRELSEDAAKRLGPIADKHNIMIGFHNHTQLKPDTYDGSILSYGEHLGINLDVGHYVAGTNETPIPLIQKHHNRILSLHIKDRKINNGPNMPLGQGDTPVALILQLMKREQWTFPADIELEYNIPQGSDAVAEVTNCVQFCKEALA
ncbi:MAG: sugar phosphate isomerase/epimerase [Candidatus Omnitrophica bacterium]|nr:sugar phosphate isomerase/epimerase [Candidatus Omnitrophota bacterium]